MCRLSPCSCMAANEAQCSELAGIRDAEARLMLADLLKAKGQQLEADCVLLSVSFRGLWEQDALPKSAHALLLLLLLQQGLGLLLLHVFWRQGSSRMLCCLRCHSVSTCRVSLGCPVKCLPVEFRGFLPRGTRSQRL